MDSGDGTAGVPKDRLHLYMLQKMGGPEVLVENIGNVPYYFVTEVVEQLNVVPVRNCLCRTNSRIDLAWQLLLMSLCNGSRVSNPRLGHLPVPPSICGVTLAKVSPFAAALAYRSSFVAFDMAASIGQVSTEVDACA
jgi:hypothetical protein